MSLSLTTTTSVDCAAGGNSSVVPSTQRGEVIIIPIGSGSATTYAVEISLDGTNFVDMDDAPTIGLSDVDVEEGTSIREDYSGSRYYRIRVEPGGTGSTVFQFFQK